MEGVTGPGSACGPAAGAMIIDYLINERRSHFTRGSDHYGGVAELINHLRADMNTSSFGTSMTDWLTGMSNHLRLHGDITDTYWRVAAVDADKNDADHTFKVRISHDEFPVVFRFDLWVDDGADFSWHFVTGVGYEEAAEGLKFGILNPDGRNNTGVKWYDWDANDQDMRMGHIYRYFN